VLRRPEVQRRIAQRIAESRVTTDEIIGTLASLMRGTLADFLDESGDSSMDLAIQRGVDRFLGIDRRPTHSRSLTGHRPPTTDHRPLPPAASATTTSEDTSAYSPFDPYYHYDFCQLSARDGDALANLRFRDLVQEWVDTRNLTEAQAQALTSEISMFTNVSPPPFETPTPTPLRENSAFINVSEPMPRNKTVGNTTLDIDRAAQSLVQQRAPLAQHDRQPPTTSHEPSTPDSAAESATATGG